MSVSGMQLRVPSIDVPRQVHVSDCTEFLGQDVILHGWLQNVRRSQAIRFISLRDRSGSVQVVCKNSGLFADIDTLATNSAIRVEGRVKSGRAVGTFEVEASGFHILARAEVAETGRSGYEPAPYAMRFLQMREPREQLTSAVRTAFLRIVRNALLDDGYLEIQTPKITAAGSESGAAVFDVAYFGQTACLAQSPQFYMQMAMASGLGRVFEIGPVFRAEPSDTNRHAAEFSCLDVELSWVASHEDLMTVEENLLRGVLDNLSETYGSDIEKHFGISVDGIVAPIPRISFEEALRVTRGASANKRTDRLTFQDEQALCKHARQRFNSDFVFVTDFPATDRPFYTMRDDGSAGGSRSFDLLWRGVEITSGCQREHDHARLARQIEAAGIPRDVRDRYLTPYYLTMFRHGCPPHGGFGLGIERFLFMLLGCASIADTSFIYRGPERLMP